MNANLKRVVAIFLRQAYLIAGNKTRFVNIFFWSSIDFLIWGFLTLYLDSVAKTSFSFVNAILGAALLWNFLIRIQQGMSMAFMEDVWARNFINLFATPLTIRQYISGIILTSLLVSILSSTALFVVAFFFFSYNVLKLGFALFVFALILFFFGLALGIFSVALVLRLGPQGEWFSWPLPFLFTPFVGVFYPIASLPLFIQPISWLIPASYVFEGMRAVLLQNIFSLNNFLMGFLLAVIYLGITYLFLLRVYKQVLRHGLITRFTAESF